MDNVDASVCAVALAGLLIALPVAGVAVLLIGAHRVKKERQHTGRSPEAGDMWTHWDEYQ